MESGQQEQLSVALHQTIQVVRIIRDCTYTGGEWNSRDLELSAGQIWNIAHLE